LWRCDCEMSCACMISYLSVRVLAFFLSFDLTHTPSIIGVCVGSTGRHLLHVVSFNVLKCPLPQVLDHRRTPLAMITGISQMKGAAAVLMETCPLLMVRILVEVWLWDVMCVYDFIFVCACSRFLSLTHTPCITGVCVGSTDRHLLHVVSFNVLKCPVPQLTQIYCGVRVRNKTNWHRHKPRSSHFNCTAVLLDTRVLLYFKIIIEVWLWDVMCVYAIRFVCACSRFLSLLALLVFAWVQRVDICFMFSRLISWNDLHHRWRNFTASVAVPHVAYATSEIITRAQNQPVNSRLPWTRECLICTATRDWFWVAVRWCI